MLAVLFCPCWAAHGRYTCQRCVSSVGGRVHHAATYIPGGADHVGPTHRWLAAVRGFRGNPSPVVVVGCRVRLLVGGFWLWWFFPCWVIVGCRLNIYPLSERKCRRSGCISLGTEGVGSPQRRLWVGLCWVCCGFFVLLGLPHERGFFVGRSL